MSQVFCRLSAIIDHRAEPQTRTADQNHQPEPQNTTTDQNTTHGNCPPVLVQTMMRKTVSEFGSKMAIVSHDGKIKWTYQDYYDQVQAVAKGFISLDLTPMHGVGIMANNHPYWQASALGIEWVSLNVSSLVLFSGEVKAHRKRRLG